MRYLVNFGRFWWEFVVGDDWSVAVGVVIGLALTALFVDLDIAAWWVMPLAVAALLCFSLWRATRLDDAALR